MLLQFLREQNVTALVQVNTVNCELARTTRFMKYAVKIDQRNPRVFCLLLKNTIVRYHIFLKPRRPVLH